MTFFEQELKKIVEPVCSDATYVGRACYVRLSEANRAKLQFVTCGYASHYDAIRATVLNKHEGEVDTLMLRFSDLLGTKRVSNPNFREGISPYVWDDHGKVDWYVYHPTRQDYQALSKAVSEYLEVFMEQTQENAQGQNWEQTMG